MDYELSKRDTSILKGIAILLMVVYHLFRFPERAGGNTYISVLQIKGMNIEYILSDFGQITIGMFVFLSAYGLYKTYGEKEYNFIESIRRIFKFLLNFWIIFIIFVPIGIFILHIYPFNIRDIILTLFCIKAGYNGEWWFAALYIELLILFPIVRLLMNKNKRTVIINILLIFILSFLIKFIVKLRSFDPNTIVQINTFVNFLYWEVIFCIGYTCARFNVLTKMKKYFVEKNLDKKSVYYCILFIVVSVRILAWIVPELVLKKEIHATYMDTILVPLLIFCSVNLIQRIQIKKTLSILGKYSNDMWLTHTFFCYYYFPDIIYLPRLSILIFIWLVVISLTISIFISFIYKKVNKICDFNFLYKKEINIKQ